MTKLNNDNYLAHGNLRVDGYTRYVNGKPIRVSGYTRRIDGNITRGVKGVAKKIYRSDAVNAAKKGFKNVAKKVYRSNSVNTAKSVSKGIAAEVAAEALGNAIRDIGENFNRAVEERRAYEEAHEDPNLYYDNGDIAERPRLENYNKLRLGKYALDLFLYSIKAKYTAKELTDMRESFERYKENRENSEKAYNKADKSGPISTILKDPTVKYASSDLMNNMRRGEDVVTAVLHTAYNTSMSALAEAYDNSVERQIELGLAKRGPMFMNTPGGPSAWVKEKK